MQQDVVLTFDALEDFKGTLRSFMAPPDQVAFERTYSIGLAKFQDEAKVEWLLWFVWRAWSRETRAPQDFEQFLAELVDYDIEVDEEAVGQNPTEGPPST